MFGSIPKPQRERLIQRLNLLVLYEGGQRWAEEYDLLSPVYTQGQSKEAFVKDLQNSEAEGLYIVLDFSPTSVITEASTKSEGQWVIMGCSKVRERGQSKSLQASVGAYWHNQEWYFSPVLVVETIHDKPPPCKYWQAKVDPSITLLRSSSQPSKANEDDPLEAIECLLKLEGKTSRSAFSSATVGYDISQRFPPATVEVAALYYASYLYHRTWHHARAMILMDQEGKKNTKTAIKAAYRAYRSWFATVREIGFREAREQRLDPLDGTNIRWY